MISRAEHNTPAITQVKPSGDAPGRRSFWIVVLVLCLSGNPVFTSGLAKELSLLGGAALLTVLVLRQGLALSRRFAAIMTLFAALLAVQAAVFQFLPASTILGYLLRLYIAYTAVVLARTFPQAYVRAMFFIGGASLAFWTLDNAMALAGISLQGMFGPLPQWLGGERSHHVLAYNFTHSEGELPYRNPGMFWEPGALAGYVTLGLVLLGLQKDLYSRRAYRLRLAVFLLCILTTRSTMGYLAMVPALALHLKPSDAPAGRGIPAIVGLIGLVLLAPAVWHADFVARKIALQAERAVERTRGWQINRFGTALFDMDYIRERPLLGWGLHRTTRYAMHPDTNVGTSQGNGLTDFTAKFGLIGLTALLILAWSGLTKAAGGHAFTGAWALLIILMSLNGETFLNHPAMLTLLFVEEGCAHTRPEATATASSGRVAHAA